MYQLKFYHSVKCKKMNICHFNMRCNFIELIRICEFEKQTLEGLFASCVAARLTARRLICLPNNPNRFLHFLHLKRELTTYFSIGL